MVTRDDITTITNDAQATIDWAEDIINETDTIPPRVVDDPPNLARCISFPRDLMRVQMLGAFLVQVIYFQYIFYMFYVPNKKNALHITALWWVTSIPTLIAILILTGMPRLFAYTCIKVTSSSLQITSGILKWTFPLKASSFYGCVSATYGDSFVPYYVVWMFYIIVYIMPRLWWLSWNTTPSIIGQLIPQGFLIFTLTFNFSMNVGYLYNRETSSRQQPFELLYEIMQRTKKSIFETLDIMNILNQLGSLQVNLSLRDYIWVSYVVLMTACVLLLFITLEVHLKVTGFWTFDSLEALLQDNSHDTRRYARAGLLGFCLFLVGQIASDIVFFLFRIIAYAQDKAPLTSFVYKNLFYVIIHMCHLYSLLILLRIYPESAYSNQLNV